MSCGFTNDATASHGASSSAAASSPKRSTTCSREHAVADEPGVGLVGAVRLATDPPREPERVEPVGPAVGVDRGGIEHAVGVVDHQALVGARDDEVGVGDVPLAPVVGAVAGGAEPVAHASGTVSGSSQVIAGSVGLLGQAVGVGDAVQRRVLPGEQRRAARRARGRPRVVAVQLTALRAEALARRELRAAELGQRLHLVRRRVPLLVRHDEQHVRSAGHRPGRYRRRSAFRRRNSVHVTELRRQKVLGEASGCHCDRRILEREREHVAHVVDEVEGHDLAHRLGHVVEVGPVALRAGSRCRAPPAARRAPSASRRRSAAPGPAA